MSRFLSLLSVLMFSSCSLQAAVLVVNSTQDNTTAADNLVTLREAIIAAESDTMTDLGDTASGIDVIDLTGLSGEISLGTVLPSIESSIVIVGPGEAELSVSGGGNDGMFFVNGGELSLAGLSLIDGNSTGGRGGDANVDGAGGGGAGMGAAVLINMGQANLFRSTFSNHTARGGRGGNTLGLAATSFGGTGGGGFSGNGGDDAGGGISFGSGGGVSGPFGNPGGAGGTVAGNNGANGLDGAGGGGGGTTAATGGGEGGFAAGGGGAGSSTSAAGPAGMGGFGGGGGGGTTDSATQGVIATGASGGEFGGNGGNGVVSRFGGGGGGGAGLGGAVFVRDGAALSVFDSVFTGNSALSGAAGQAFTAGGADGTSGQGKGGAVFVSDAATAVGDMLSFSGNSASNASSSPEDNINQFGMIQTGQVAWLEFGIDEILVSENSGTVQVPLHVRTSDGLSTTSLTELVVVHRDIDATAGLDYAAVSDQITVPIGTPDGNVLNVPVTLLSDMDAEMDERFRLEVSSINGAILSSQFTQVIRILDGANPDVRISKTANVGLVAPGEMIDYTIVVTNEGNVDLDNVHIEDALPNDLTAASWMCVAGFNSSCGASGTGDIDDRASLPVGSLVTYLLTATVAPTATQDISNTATATLPFALIDNAPADNTATEVTAIDILFADSFESVMRRNITGLKSIELSVLSNSGSSPITILQLVDDNHDRVYLIQQVEVNGRRFMRVITETALGRTQAQWKQVNQETVWLEQ